jgi:hypothetical protein
MQSGILTLEVDGSLQNPIVLRAVLLCGVLLGVVTAVVVRWCRRGGLQREHGRVPLLLVVGALGFLYLATPIAQFIVGSALYQVQYAGSPRRLASVGFWGGPPVLPAWAMGATGGIIAAIITSRRRSSEVQGPAESADGTTRSGTSCLK